VDHFGTGGDDPTSGAVYFGDSNGLDELRGTSARTAQLLSAEFQPHP